MHASDAPSSGRGVNATPLLHGEAPCRCCEGLPAGVAPGLLISLTCRLCARLPPPFNLSPVRPPPFFSGRGNMHRRLPPTHSHPMWLAWDMAAEMCLMQLPTLLSDPGADFQPSPFFSEQLTAFELWLLHGSRDKKPPEQLPIVLQYPRAVQTTSLKQHVPEECCLNRNAVENVSGECCLNCMRGMLSRRA
eukprot:103386-Chlamydomonas_euryale.AAC.2